MTDDLELPEFLDRRKHPRDTEADFEKARKRRREAEEFAYTPKPEEKP